VQLGDIQGWPTSPLARPALKPPPSSARIAAALRGKQSAIMATFNIVGPVVRRVSPMSAPRERRTSPATFRDVPADRLPRTRPGPAEPPTRSPSGPATSDHRPIAWKLNIAEVWGLGRRIAGRGPSIARTRRDRLRRFTDKAFRERLQQPGGACCAGGPAANCCRSSASARRRVVGATAASLRRRPRSCSST